jgi:serine/threonine-protein kinase
MSLASDRFGPMDHPAATYATFTPTATVAREPFRVGEWIGGCFRLRRLLGRGGMSCVFEADDTLLSRKVAIKVVDDAELGATLLVHEAKALAAVRHHGLPVIYGMGVHRGWTYLVLERLVGITLEEHLRGPRGQRALDTAEALPILGALGDVLAAVHTAGMAHRDLKPANTMLCGGMRTVLLDFGIVLPEVAVAHMTRSGTPGYVAPEVIRGSVAPGQAHLVDIYAFGTMAYEMFAARAPFETGATADLLEHHLTTPAPDLAAVRPDLPPRLVSLIGACLAKDPGDRPSSMEAVVWELGSVVARRPVSTPAVPRVEPVKRPATRET